MSKDVYIPVCVTVDDDGNAVSANVDISGAPWMYVDSQENVWDEDEQEWIADADAENEAESWLNGLLSGFGENIRS